MNARARYLATTLALLAIGVAAAWWQARPATPVFRPTRVATVGPPAHPAPAATARAVLDRRVDLVLTAEQVRLLEALDRRWVAESAPLRGALDTAQRDLAGFLGAQAGGRATLGELERQSAEYRSLSAELRARSRRHADATVDILTEPQRRALGLAAAGSNGEGR